MVRPPWFSPTVVLCACVLLVAALPVGAQTPAQGAVTGRVINATTGEPVVAAVVQLRSAADSADRTVVAEAVTNAEGRYRLNGVGTGRYRVHITQLGYSEHSGTVIEVSQGEAVTDAGTVRLEVSAVELDEIAAQAERSPVVMEVDRTVYSTADMPAAKGGTATDLLRQIPELEVDIDGKVALRGNQAVAIHLNGRPAPMKGDALNNFLQQMPADRIAKVEVMPNPSARNDPEGNGGIVNIILLDDVDLGLSGNLTANAGSRGARGFNGRLAYQKGRFTFFGGAGLNFSDYSSSNSDVRQNLLATPITILEQDGERVSDNAFQMVDVTAEYKLAGQTTAWVAGMYWGGGYSSDISMAYGLFDQAHLMLDSYDRITASDHDNSSADYSAGLKHAFVPQKHELTVDVRRSGHGTDGETLVEKLSRLDPGNPLLELTDQQQEDDNTDFMLRADYTRPLGEKGKLDAGINIGRRAVDQDYHQEVLTHGADIPVDVTENRFSHEEQFNSAYVTLAQVLGPVNVQAGLRAELADTRLSLPVMDEHFDNDYRSLFPSLNLTWTAGEGKTVRFSYAKRISRPYAWILNPYTPQTDPLNRSVGNPDIEPAYTHSFSLDMSRIGRLGTLRLAPYWRRTTNNWENIKRVDENGVSTVTWENSASSESMGASLTASLRPAGRISGSATVGLHRVLTDASNISTDLSRESVRWSVGANSAVRVTGSLNAQLSANYMPGRDVPQGRMSAMFMSSVGLRQQLMDQRATLSLFVSDPFDLYEFRFETRDRSHVQNSRTGTSMRRFRLSLTWNFGKPPEQVSRREGGPTTAEETARIR